MDTKKKGRKMQEFKVAFNSKGDLMSDNCSWMQKDPRYASQYKWEDNAPFADTFEYAGYRGASGGNSHILFKSVNSGREVNMFMSDFDEVITQDRFINKQIVGLFCYCKKGSKQAVRLIFDGTP
jgi:hypothetical protein